MGKKIVRLTEQEFKALIKHAINESLDEIDGATYAKVHNATMRAQQNQLSGIPSGNNRKSNMDIIQQGIGLDKRASDSLISPYKTDYLFHCTNLRGTASITIFNLEELYLLNDSKAILKGEIIFNGEHLNGSIVVEMPTHKTYYNYKGKAPKYLLQIDPSKKDVWEGLLHQLDISLQKRKV